MSIFSMRPTFETLLPYSAAIVFDRVSEELGKPPWNATSLVFDRYAEMHIPEAEARYWSPHLSLTFDGDETQTRIIGRLAPRQNVWTLVWIFYLAFAFAGFNAMIFAYSHWIIGKSTWVIAIVPLSLVGIASLYAVSQVGQSWSADQIAQLRSDWQRLVHELFPLDERRTPIGNSLEEPSKT